MKVLQLISSRGFFGAENVVVELASSLEAAGDSVTIGIFSNRHTNDAGSSELSEQAMVRGLKTKIFECGGRMDLKTVAAIRRFVEENGIDVIHSHGYKSNIYACLANRKLKKRLITTCHNWINASSKMSLYTRLDKFFLRRFDVVAAVSEDVKGQLLKSSVDPGKIRIIGNGINLEKFSGASCAREKTRTGLGIPLSAFVVGTVGRLSPEKGYGFFLEAAKEILSKKSDCFILFVGDGVQRRALEEQARSLGIRERVIFAGKRSDIPDALSAMDVFVLSSLTEGQPMALLEAMAARVPAVSTSVGDVPKILKDGKAGLVVPPSDSAALAKAALKVLEDPALAAKLSVNANRAVREGFSSERMAAEYRACYKG
jgi:glycosyltransferase involved in cell wall biosynthesis